ncbi:hypothetical protein [Filifactor villosus]|uniref:Uncharacterized protein n=1 Tax=Filifactor villosus TaxID=29374 RepID=A0ABV9QNM4_9FIRM
MGINRLAGTPWHMETLKRREGDERRYKGRCFYYQYRENRCTRRNTKCTGSAQCPGYKAISEDEFRKRQKEQTKNKKKVMKTIAIGIKRRQVCGEFENSLVQRSYI